MQCVCNPISAEDATPTLALRPLDCPLSQLSRGETRERCVCNSDENSLVKKQNTRNKTRVQNAKPVNQQQEEKMKNNNNKCVN